MDGDTSRGWGRFHFHGHGLLAFPAPFGLTSCWEFSPTRGLFFSSQAQRTAIQALPVDGGGSLFAFMRLLRNFQWYDFASIFVYGKV